MHACVMSAYEIAGLHIQCDYERLEAIVQLEAANEEASCCNAHYSCLHTLPMWLNVTFQIGKLSVEIQELQKKLDTTDKQVHCM